MNMASKAPHCNLQKIPSHKSPEATRSTFTTSSLCAHAWQDLFAGHAISSSSKHQFRDEETSALLAQPSPYIWQQWIDAMLAYIDRDGQRRGNPNGSNDGADASSASSRSSIVGYAQQQRQFAQSGRTILPPHQADHIFPASSDDIFSRFSSSRALGKASKWAGAVTDLKFAAGSSMSKGKKHSQPRNWIVLASSTSSGGASSPTGSQHKQAYTLDGVLQSFDDGLRKEHRGPFALSSTSLPQDNRLGSTLPANLQQSNEALAVLVPLLVLLSTLLLLLLLFLIMLILVRRRARIALALSDGPLDVGREEELEGAGGLEGVEERWLETQDEATRRGYARAKDWVLSHPPASDSSEITISQFLSIQEKGVSAWSFEPDYEANSSCYVEARTEITFVADGEGMATGEGGGCAVQSNLPLPRINEVYYWEAKMFTKPDTTNIALGLATKPYPSFRMPGWSKYSVGFFSQDGFKSHNYPFSAQSYGPAYVQGDVIGVGYRPRTGTVFFTRNGKKLDDAFVGLNRYSLFPTVGSDGPAEVHVNLGQAGFVFIEANVKKWGLAPMVGTLAPPPAYGQERGSILIEAAEQGPSSQPQSRLGQIGINNSISAAMMLGGRRTPPPPPTPPGEESPYPSDRLNAYDRRTISQYTTTSSASSSSRRSRRSRRNNNGTMGTASGCSGEQQQQQYLTPSAAELRGRSISSASSERPLNPPTPGNLDISLHSLNPSSGGGSNGSGTAEASSRQNFHAAGSHAGSGSAGPVEDLAQALNGYFPPLQPSSPPPYSNVSISRSSSLRNRDVASQHALYLPGRHQSRTSSSPGSLGGTAEMGNQARRSPHHLASTVFGNGILRGLTSLSSSAGADVDGRNNAEARDLGLTAGSQNYEGQTANASNQQQQSTPSPSSVAATVVGHLRGWLWGDNGGVPSSTSTSGIQAA